MKTIVSVAAACGCITFATAAEEPTEAEKGEFKVEDIVPVELGLNLDSRYMNYGVIDGKVYSAVIDMNAYKDFLNRYGQSIFFS